LRLVWIHVVGPGREIDVISDRHQDILNVVWEQIEGYAPLHHRWCTRHLAENLLRKDGVKDNFDLFQEIIVWFYLQYVISFHYVRNIKLNIMTTDNENNNTIKSPILGHIKQHNNTRSTYR
jgi:hypothetical protein